jgi:general L-amino acid transport system substrate-binding protein
MIARLRFQCRFLLLAAVLLVLAGAAEAGATLDAVKARGTLVCGVSTGVAGFSIADSAGRYIGFDVDICRAVAAAVIGSAQAVRYVALTTQQRFTALQTGEVDILSRDTTWTLQREAGLGLLFAPTVFYDGQGFMVPRRLHVTSVGQLSGATVCVQPGTSTELALADYFRAARMTYRPVVIENFEALEAAFYGGRCDAYTTDASALAVSRLTRADNPGDYVILPERISGEPLAPAVRQGDDQWFDVVRWTVFALIDAEEKGITMANAEAMLTSPDPQIQRLLGVTLGGGKALGLKDSWAYDAIRQVGNYGEIYERNLGLKSALKLPRGPNALVRDGGLLYAPPLQ